MVAHLVNELLQFVLVIARVFSFLWRFIVILYKDLQYILYHMTSFISIDDRDYSCDYEDNVALQYILDSEEKKDET